jgi:hypothetical protein
MHLVAFLLAGPTAHHHGAWRHPEADLGVITPQWHKHIACVLEQGRFDSLFFADMLALYNLFGGSFATILRCGGQMELLDPNVRAILPRSRTGAAGTRSVSPRLLRNDLARASTRLNAQQRGKPCRPSNHRNARPAHSFIRNR